MKHSDANETLLKDGEGALRARLDAAAVGGPYRPAANGDARSTEASGEFVPESVAALATEPKPVRDFLDSASLLPMRNVTLISGEGGVGKSLLALQLAVACVAGSEWIGLPVSQGPVLYLSAEDDRDEIHIRLSDVCAAEGLTLGDAADLHVLYLAGKDSVLAVEKNGQVTPTKNFDRLKAAVRMVKPRLLILDNQADIFSVNENIRTLAKHCVGLLRGLALDFNCAVLLLGHPSLSGLNSGTGMSGSTAWHNSVRSRLYLTAKRNGDGDDEEHDPDQRFLRAMKANYAPLAEPISLRWQEGRYVRADPESAFRGVTTQHLEKVRDTFRKGEYRYDERSPDWGGSEVARIIDVDIGLGLVERDLTSEQKAARRKVRTLLSAWMRNKQIRMIERPDKKRMMRKFYEAV
ncbi:AAA family ATPase [Mesorhizobium sp.]|uniref:AAA family ATPase n=1 Tax=Mesorhizobium sp. TaxID=1871066 RepID=UPI000FE8FC44|nr:AAA family ATPase [Mesorhizobium sp.]RWQ47092.1 MAG: hypothetical protein EOS83_28350 [Mesorhizobium sp.]